MWWTLLLLFLLLSPSRGQRYAERNVPPAPSSQDVLSPSYEDPYEDYDEEGLYGFQVEDDHPDVYKWIVDQYPHPLNNPRFCNRMKPSHVCDPDVVLGREQADLLEASIQRLYRETPCICETCESDEGGLVVGIALLKHLHHPYHMHHAKVIRSFAESLRSRWKLGRCENDILIVVATADRLSYTDVGRATSRHLSLNEAHRIFLENKAKFSANNFSEGLADILAGYHRATRAMRGKGNGGRNSLDVPLVAGALVGSVLLLGALLFLGFVVYRKRTSGRRKDVTDAKRPNGSSVSSSWSKKDIKVLFSPESRSTKVPLASSAQYQKCGTDDDVTGDKRGEEDEMDFTLASPDDTSFDQTRVTQLTADSESLERDLTTAAEGLARTFPAQNGTNNVLVTDM